MARTTPDAAASLPLFDPAQGELQLRALQSPAEFSGVDGRGGE